MGMAAVGVAVVANSVFCFLGFCSCWFPARKLPTTIWFTKQTGMSITIHIKLANHGRILPAWYCLHFLLCFHFPGNRDTSLANWLNMLKENYTIEKRKKLILGFQLLLHRKEKVGCLPVLSANKENIKQKWKWRKGWVFTTNACIFHEGERKRKRSHTCTGLAATNKPATPPPTTRPSGLAKETLMPPVLFLIPPVSVGINDPVKESISNRPWINKAEKRWH